MPSVRIYNGNGLGNGEKTLHVKCLTASLSSSTATLLKIKIENLNKTRRAKKNDPISLSQLSDSEVSKVSEAARTP